MSDNTDNTKTYDETGRFGFKPHSEDSNLFYAGHFEKNWDLGLRAKLQPGRAFYIVKGDKLLATLEYKGEASSGAPLYQGEVIISGERKLYSAYHNENGWVNARPAATPEPEPGEMEAELDSIIGHASPS